MYYEEYTLLLRDPHTLFVVLPAHASSPPTTSCKSGFTLSVRFFCGEGKVHFKPTAYIGRSEQHQDEMEMSMAYDCWEGISGDGLQWNEIGILIGERTYFVFNSVVHLQCELKTTASTAEVKINYEINQRNVSAVHLCDMPNNAMKSSRKWNIWQRAVLISVMCMICISCLSETLAASVTSRQAFCWY